MPLERKKRYIAIRKEARDAGNSSQGMKIIYGHEKKCFLTCHTVFLDVFLTKVAGTNKSIQCISPNNQFSPTLKF